MSARIIPVPIGGRMRNRAYVVGDPAAGVAAVVDPGADAEKILAAARSEGLSIEQIWITHEHPDHYGAAAEVRDATGARVLAHAAAATYVGADAVWKDGDIATVAGLSFQVLHTPGHSPGGVCLFGAGVVFTGDTLFVGNCGRVDFPGGDPAAMLRSLSRLAALPDATRVLPGHHYGAREESTIGAEKAESPYLRCRDLGEFLALP